MVSTAEFVPIHSTTCTHQVQCTPVVATLCRVKRLRALKTKGFWEVDKDTILPRNAYFPHCRMSLLRRD